MIWWLGWIMSFGNKLTSKWLWHVRSLYFYSYGARACATRVKKKWFNFVFYFRIYQEKLLNLQNELLNIQNGIYLDLILSFIFIFFFFLKKKGLIRHSRKSLLTMNSKEKKQLLMQSALWSIKFHLLNIISIKTWTQ